tara:strand:+ start:262 stop:1098 length:837 start_codon:yes stop_codon:yes gene_type:complete
MQTKALGRLQYLAGIIDSQTKYLPPVKLTESELAEFDLLWEESINYDALYQLTEEEQNAMQKILSVVKKLSLAIGSGLLKFGKGVFIRFNKLVWYFLTKVLPNPLYYVLVAVGVGWEALSSLLDFDIPTFKGKFNPGEAMDASALALLEKTYDGMISQLKNAVTDPNFVTAPFDVLTEIIAGIFTVAKVAVPAIFNATIGVCKWIVANWGIAYPAAVVCWIYLIGGGKFFFDKAKGITEPFLKDKVVKAVEDEANKNPLSPEKKAEVDKLIKKNNLYT